jgi:predicted dehydrogenase
MQAIAESGVAQVVALSDPSADAIAAAQQVACDARVVPSFEAMLECELDGVVIATPSALHAEQSARALDRGCAVFCQKPLGRSASEVRHVLERAIARDRLLGVDLSYRYTDAVQKIRSLAQSGELGDVYAVQLTFHNAYGPDKPWFYDPKQAGGGALVDLGIHLLDLALWILDFPEIDRVSSQLFAQGRPLIDRELQVEDFVSAQLSLERGTVLDLSCSWRLHAGVDCAIEASFYGTRGGARMRNVSGSFYDFSAEAMTGTTRRSVAEPPDAWGGRAAVAWAKQLAESPRFDPAAKRLLDVAQVMDRIYAEALTTKTRQPVRMERPCAS